MIKIGEISTKIGITFTEISKIGKEIARQRYKNILNPHMVVISTCVREPTRGGALLYPVFSNKKRMIQF